MKSIVLYLAGAVLFVGNLYYCMKVIPVRPHITYVNHRYIDNVSATVRRYSRRSDYVLNLEFTTKEFFGNNLTIKLVFYEYLHNEYRLSFVELNFQLCELILKEPFLGSIIKKAGVTACPMLPRKYSMTNMTFDQEIPSVWPFEKGKAELIATLYPSEEVIGKGDLVVIFKQKLKTG